MEFSENQNQLNKNGNAFVQAVFKTNKIPFSLIIYPITLSVEHQSRILKNKQILIVCEGSLMALEMSSWNSNSTVAVIKLSESHLNCSLL